MTSSSTNDTSVTQDDTTEPTVVDIDDARHQSPSQNPNTENETEHGETNHDGSDENTTDKNISAEEKYQDLHDQYLRLAADFENFRKRVASERESLLKYGAVSTIDALLPVMDNLERATGSLNDDSDPKLLYQSFSMLANQLVDELSSLGLKKIAPLGQPFDPQFHEAVAQQPATEDYPDNTVMAVQQSGYQVHDRVIRPAQVIVATNTSPDTSSPDNAPKQDSDSPPPSIEDMPPDNPFADSDTTDDKAE